MPIVQFECVTGLARSPFTAASLLGSWDGWAPREMQRTDAGFAAEVELDGGGETLAMEAVGDGPWRAEADDFADAMALLP